MTEFTHFVSISGGKDSLAAALLAKERRERSPMDIRYLNADLGINESQLTHDYIGYLEIQLGATIERVRADFVAEFETRRQTIQDHWSREKRRKEHSAACKARRAAIPPIVSNCRPSTERQMAVRAWAAACDCPERISPPVPQWIIDRAISLLVPSGEPFLDLCMLKGRFPSRTAQFCTERLKLEPINAITHPILDSGRSIVSWIGERADESPKRAAKPAIERHRWDGGAIHVLYRPIHKWSAAETFAIAKRHGVKPNPLYLMGFSRVGCFCINQDKSEIAQWEKRFPEVIERIRAWEAIVALVSRRQAATFFAPMLGSVPNSIDDVVKWSKTSRGGRQFDLLKAIDADLAATDGPMCESAYGLCE